MTISLVTGAGAASAATPSSWNDPEPTTHLHELILYGGSLVGLMIFLTLFSIAVHRNDYVPPPPSDEVEKSGGHEPAHR